MKVFLSIAAVLAWLFGLALLFVPGKFYAAGGLVMTPLMATVAQAHGATLFGLGVINWIARNAEGKGLMAVLWGNLVVQVLSFVVAVRIATLAGVHSTLPAFFIHGILGILFIVFLVRARRALHV